MWHRLLGTGWKQNWEVEEKRSRRNHSRIDSSLPLESARKWIPVQRSGLDGVDERWRRRADAREPGLARSKCTSEPTSAHSPSIAPAVIEFSLQSRRAIQAHCRDSLVCQNPSIHLSNLFIGPSPCELRRTNTLSRRSSQTAKCAYVERTPRRILYKFFFFLKRADRQTDATQEEPNRSQLPLM